ncbi:hypothetical protein ABEG18_06525 [Alsobacter sp. KACC 23698]|uniref:Uncharacterized protein n=1 Tax=Alsobacter sp. KACC 23698 TaxID=3149229 RepID=A0AAU7JJ56_9HYPH
MTTEHTVPEDHSDSQGVFDQVRLELQRHGVFISDEEWAGMNLMERSDRLKAEIEGLKSQHAE